MANMDKNADLYQQRLCYQKNAAPRQPLALPWWVRTSQKTIPVRHCCEIMPLICGEEVFKKIAEDIKNARHSVDIITWGFDPGMVLIRGASAEIGQRYGDLLKEVATRKTNPVQVRLVIWHDDVAADWKQKNMPGYHGWRFPFIGGVLSGYYSEAHQTYNAKWFAQICAGVFDNRITLHVRNMPVSDARDSLQEETPPSGLAAWGSTLYPTHHQKMILIDYEDPPNAIGYVMGHNSVTDFWDTTEHIFQDPRRECIFAEDPIEARRRIEHEGEPLTPWLGDQSDRIWTAYKHDFAPWKKKVQDYLDRLPRQVSKPYQDVSARVRGEVLCDLNKNFCQAWQESAKPSAGFLDYLWTVPKFVLRAVEGLPLARITPAMLVAEYAAKQYAKHAPVPAFIQRRRTIPEKDFRLKDGQHSVQLLRTHPSYKEKSIKECYANLTRQMQHYIFIQNQYLQYEDWADHLTKCVENLRKCGDNRQVYVFILTSTPELTGMDRPTYSVVSKLGQGETMNVEHQEALIREIKNNGPSTLKPDLLSKRGINVVIGSLWCCKKTPQATRITSTDYEEIYIHSKIAIVDDAALTIGSANLNVRSMSFDSELNILTESREIAYSLRKALFSQCTTSSGPAQFQNMRKTHQRWSQLMQSNKELKAKKQQLLCSIFPFEVNRAPGATLI